MLKKNALTLSLLVAIIVLLAFLYRSRSGPVSAPAPAGTPLNTAVPSSPKVATPNPKPSAPPPPLEVSHLADALNSPATDIQADLRLLLQVVTTFRSNFPTEGNPVGSNAEITATLTGQNKLRFAFIPPDHSAINKNGELCDRWGTPFFFHAESGVRMTVQSAGPDKKRHTADDVVLSP